MKPTKELMNRELQMFKKYHVDAKDIKCLLEWLGKHEPLFFIVAFIVHQILGIVEFGIEIDK
jgi:hypothetical protein